MRIILIFEKELYDSIGELDTYDFIINAIVDVLTTYFVTEEFDSKCIKYCISHAVEQGENMLMRFKEKKSTKRKVIVFLRYLDDCVYYPLLRVYDLDNNMLFEKGLIKFGKEHKIGNKNENTKGNDNIITNGSILVVADGQCALIVDQGMVVDVCAEPGEYTYDASTEPTIFCGNLGEGIKKSFAAFGKPIPQDRNKREKFLDKMESDEISDILSDCDDQFYEYPDQLEDLCYQYIVANKEKFA